MTSHLVALVGGRDNFVLQVPAGDVYIVPFDRAGDPHAIGDDTRAVLSAHGLDLLGVAADLLRLAISAYAADTHFSRVEGFDRWTRDIRLHLPVSDPEVWSQAHEQVISLLAFLTGDHWQIEFRPLTRDHNAPRQAALDVELSVDAVCLFSGGLDSFIGAVDSLESGRRVALVGHHAKGTGATSVSQNKAIDALRSAYGIQSTPFLRFWVSPKKGRARTSETSLRGRSLLFLALGISVATAAGATELIVPENGFISLNVPLTNSRLGSLSTRTTHPYFLARLRGVLTSLGVEIQLRLPYRFKTKGEMVLDCSNSELLRTSASETMSCSHPESNRFRARDPQSHCGRCLPCLIRRAALSAWDDTTKYVHRNLSNAPTGKSGADLRAMKLALARYRTTPASMAHVLTAGPLPGTDEEREEYVEVFRRGLEEVRSFLRRYDRTV